MLAEQSTDIGLLQLLDALPDAVIWMKAMRNEVGEIVDFQIAYANQKAQDITRNHYKVSPGTRVLEVNGHERAESERNFREMYAVLETNQPREITYFNAKLNGWFLVHRTKLGDGILSITRSISALKAAEHEKAEQANLLNSVLNSSSNAIMALKAIRDETRTIVDFVVTLINEAGATMFRKPAEIIIGQRISAICPLVTEKGLFDQYVAVAETQKPTHIYLDYEENGAEIWYDMALSPLGDGLTVTYTDISESHKTQQAIAQSAEEMRTIIDSAQIVIFVITPVRNLTGQIVDFRFRMANQPTGRYVNQEPETIIGHLVSNWFPTYLESGLLEQLAFTLETGQAQDFPFQYNADGIDVSGNITTARLGDDLLVTFLDYTPLKKLEEQLQSSIVDLQRSNKNLEQFAYIASHDLQEPLRKIQSFGDMLQAKYGTVLDELGVNIIQRMQTAAARMQLLIKDVLAYSRIANKQETVALVDLNEVLQNVATDLETAILEKQANVVIGQMPVLRGDAVQLRQLFQNIISNSLKFCKDDEQNPPKVTIACQPVLGQHVTAIPVSSRDSNRAFHLIEITDNGIGFEPHQAGRIFQVFQRLHNKSDYTGTGIGLAIVQKVIDNHHGYVMAEGRPAEGATFRIWLPA
ncbi:hypothetical protein GCM10028807_43860 [Spirosoma daeguense]